ncbi:MAG TPA: HlyD family type I secretion periplasmic adaptor subunit [Allosphingosinicella sp.]
MNEMRHIEDYADRMRPKTASNILFWVILGFFVLFFAWAAVAELDRTVRGQGRVVASSQLQTVSNLEGGVVQAIMVRTGQDVKAGQELIRLDPTQTGSELGSGTASASALAAKIARLQAEVTGRNPVYPAAPDVATANQIQIERSLHASRMAELSSLVNAGRSRIVQAQRAVQEAQANYAARITARDARLQELNVVRPLVERGIEPRLSLMQAESGYAVAQSEAAAAAAAVSRAQSAIGEAQSSLAQQQQDWRSLAATELATAQGEYQARRSSLPALQERVDRTSVKAPLAGRINRVLVTTVGAAIAPGAPLVEIVPSEESLLIETQVRPQDIAFARMNQEARVSITAYDSSIYGSLEGVVVAISPDATVNERTGESFYTVQVRTKANALKDKQGKPLPIGTGMVADVSLLGDKRTILEYILSPLTKLKDTAFRE